MIDSKTLKTLEYDKVLDILSGYAASSYTKESIKKLTPNVSFNDVKNELELTKEAFVVLYELALTPNRYYDDLTDELNIARKNGVLSMRDLLRVAVTLKNIRSMKSCIDSVNSEKVSLLHEKAEFLYTYEGLEEDITRCIIGENEMADSASSKLYDIRREIKSTIEKIRRKLNAYISDPTYRNYLQDTLVTVRNNRQVVPVKSECRSFIPGLIHDESQSGATVYIEPLIVVELNNDLRKLYIEENNEIERILRDFTSRIKLIAENIKISQDTMRFFDEVFAKAEYAKDIKAIKPDIVIDGSFNIIKGRHPLLDPKKVVPVAVYVNKATSILLITGSNTGGKTVSLKLVGLLSLMAMSGIFIPAEDGSLISVYENIFCDIGDEQSIEQSLSTFSSHTKNLIDITSNITANSLALLDELGAGTDPAEGSALAIAVSEKIIETGAKAIVTTHYNELKEYAFSSEKMETASMDFDPNTFAPTYKLLMGVVGASNAIEIASRLGLDSGIVDKARSLISADKLTFDKVMMSAEYARKKAEEYSESIENTKKEIEKRLEEIEQERMKIIGEREKLNANIHKEAKKLLSEYMEEADELVDELKETVKIKTEKNLFKARQLRSKLSKISYDEETDENVMKFDDSEINVGDEVFIKRINNKGVVTSINERRREYGIKAGIITTTAKFDEVKKLVKTEKKTAAKSYQSNRITAETKYEINVIGQESEEAIFNVDRFLDDAALSGMAEVRVVHGKGSGILRKNLREHFKRHPGVASYREGAYGEGDAGVTIVTLK